MPNAHMYTEEENAFLIIAREGTKLSWQEITDFFNSTFGTAVSSGSVKVRYNSRLRGTSRAFALDCFLKSSPNWRYDPRHVDFLGMAVAVLKGAPERIRYRLPHEGNHIPVKGAGRSTNNNTGARSHV